MTTISQQQVPTPRQVRKQIRGFVIIWTLITFMMALATFLAIYFTYSPPGSSGSRPNVAIPQAGNGSATEAVVVLPSITLAPSSTPTATHTPDAQATAVAAALLEPTSTPTDAPPPTATPTPLPVENTAFQAGIQVQYSLDLNPDNQDGYYRSVANDLRLRWVKQQVRWEDVEPAQGQYDWNILDLTIPSAGRFMLNTMISVVTAPDWAREPGANLSRHGPPANNQDFVNFILTILDRYPGQIQAIEVWNEQNIDREWSSVSGLSASRYVTMLREVYTAVKAVDPGIIIISGALSPTGVDDGVGAINDFRYMEQMIAAGMLDVSDCVGAHHNGYNIGPSVRWDAVPNDPSARFRGPFDNPHHSWSFRSTLEGYASRVANAGRSTPLCVTEFGWAVTEDLDGFPAGFEFAADNTLDEQATWFPEALSNMEDWGFVWLAFIWNFNYAPQAGWDPSNDNVPYSLIGPGWSFRPAYDAIREWQADYLARTGQ